MIELTSMEIDGVAGGMSFGWIITLGDAIIEFASGFIDGVNAAQQ